jgi:hypothetical protein
MECVALKSFQSKYGFIRQGSPFTAEKSYGLDLIGLKLARESKPDLQPQRVQAFAKAPQTKGKDPPASPPPPENPTMAGSTDDGPAKPSLLSRVVRASRRRTAK